MSIRQPSVAGTFYPSQPTHLRQFCEPHLRSQAAPLRVRAVILPHAGYIYSGITACRVLSQVQVPQRNFLIGPNHRGIGSEFALYQEGQWETPLGRVSMDRDLAGALLKGSTHLVYDEEAHRLEHSLEVIVPLLQMKNPGLTMVPLLVGTLDLDLAREAARECAEVLKRDSEVLLVISNDMSHYDDDETTRKKDRYAMEAILNLDPGALVKAVRQHRVTMCGYIPVYMLLVMSQPLGIRKAALVDYRTSADATGDRDRVVGYAGFILE